MRRPTSSRIWALNVPATPSGVWPCVRDYVREELLQANMPLVFGWWRHRSSHVTVPSVTCACTSISPAIDASFSVNDQSDVITEASSPVPESMPSLLASPKLALSTALALNEPVPGIAAERADKSHIGPTAGPRVRRRTGEMAEVVVVVRAYRIAEFTPPENDRVIREHSSSESCSCASTTRNTSNSDRLDRNGGCIAHGKTSKCRCHRLCSGLPDARRCIFGLVAGVRPCTGR